MKAVIFDCDGTLVDSEVLSNEVLVEAVAEHGMLLSVDDAVRSFRGCKMADCVSQLEARLGRPLPVDFVTSLRTRTAAAFRTRLRAIDGALELVQSLRQSVCVASSGPMEKIELSLALTGLLPYFKGRIFSSYEVGSWKPDPDLFLHAARVIGVTPAECAVVEDSLPGIRAGLAAGMTVFAFQPYGAAPSIPGQVTIVKELIELRRVLQRGAAEPGVADGRGPPLRSDPRR
jgi:HAD superfamily hydrolase (TIGR01509 family)